MHLLAVGVPPQPRRGAAPRRHPHSADRPLLVQQLHRRRLGGQRHVGLGGDVHLHADEKLHPPARVADGGDVEAVPKGLPGLPVVEQRDGDGARGRGRERLPQDLQLALVGVRALQKAAAAGGGGGRPQPWTASRSSPRLRSAGPPPRAGSHRPPSGARSPLSRRRRPPRLPAPAAIQRGLAGWLALAQRPGAPVLAEDLGARVAR